MKKILCSIALLLTFAVPSWASFQSVVMSPAGALYAFALAHISPPITGGLVYYGMLPGTSTSITPDGYISRPSEAVWIRADDLVLPQTVPPPVPVKKDVTAKMPYGGTGGVFDIGTKLAAGVPVYPGIKAALFSSELFGVAVNTPVGATVSAPGVTGAIHVLSSSETITSLLPGEVIVNQTLHWVKIGKGFVNGVSGNVYTQHITYENVAVPGPTQKTPLKFAEGITADGSGTGPVKTVYQAELDKMMQDDSYVPVFSDDTTGLPYAPPAGAASQAQIDAHNASGTSGHPTTTTTTGAPVIVNNGDGTSTRTTTTTTMGGSGAPTTTTTTTTHGTPDGTGPPTDTTTTDDSGGTPPALPGDNTYAGGTDADKPIKKDIPGILSSFISASPLVAMVQSFTITTSGTGEVEVGTLWENHSGGTPMMLSFTRWEALLRALGGILLAIFHGYAVKIALKGW